MIHNIILFLFRAQAVENENSEGETDDEVNLTAASSRIGKGMSRKKMVRKRTGRMSQWPEHLLNNMIDIITGDEYFNNKLIFTKNRKPKNSEIYESILDKMKACANEAVEGNEAVEFSCMHIRNKFKKVVSECKRAAVLMKSASGIKRFQEERGYEK